MLCADDCLYVVKFQNNPQHIRVLANELMATRLADAIGLTVPHCEVIHVGKWLIEQTPELEIQLAHTQERCRSGLQFGSQYVGGLMPGQVCDRLEDEDLLRVRNLNEFAGIVSFDKWTCNTDGRQAVFLRRPREKRHSAIFIDQGYCFNSGEWRFSDSPLRGVYGRQAVYDNVRGWDAFEPWLSRIEHMDAHAIQRIGREVPPEWYGHERPALKLLLDRLRIRQSGVRELIGDIQRSTQKPFPNWQEPLSIS
jgi:hypothetical protein